MKITTDKLQDYIVVQELLGYDARDRLSHRLRAIKLPERVTKGFVMKLLYRLSPSYIEEATLVRVRSPEDAKAGTQYAFLDDDDVKPEKPCNN